MEVGPVELLAKYVTALVTIYAYEGSVRLAPRQGRKKDLTITGRVLDNFYGNQESLIPFMEVSQAYRMVGSSVPTPGMGGAFAHLVIDKNGEGFYQLGYECDGREDLVDLDSQGLLRLLNACRIAMRSSRSFHYDENFWVVSVMLGLYDVSVTSQDITIDPGAVESPVRILRTDQATWRKCFSAVDELSQCEKRSQLRVADDVMLYKTGDDSYTIKWENPKDDMLLFGKRTFFSVLQEIVRGFWTSLSDDYYDDELGVDMDDDDDEEGSVP